MDLTLIWLFDNGKFPEGVAVEELKQYGGRKKLKEEIPHYVVDLLHPKGLMPDYEIFVDELVESGIGKKMKCWNIGKIKEIVRAHKTKFEAKGIALFISHKTEYVSHGQYGKSDRKTVHESMDGGLQRIFDCTMGLKPLFATFHSYTFSIMPFLSSAGGHNEYFRWVEFVDREQQPNYYPQRDAETTRQCEEACVIS